MLNALRPLPKHARRRPFRATWVIDPCAQLETTMSIPTPKKATCQRLCKYSSHEHIDRLRVIILENDLYIPSLKELNDPVDGLPKLAVQSEDEMASFFYGQYIRLHPNMTREEQEKEAAIIRYNVSAHSPAGLQPLVVEALDRELKGYRIYSLTKRYDKMNLWAQYAAQHRGYCLEFMNEGPFFEHARQVSYLDPKDMEIPITSPVIKNGDFFFCKTRDWSNEEEVRLVLPRGKGSRVKIDPHWLARLIVGKDMSPADQDLIRKWASLRRPELVVVTAYYDPVNREIRIRV